MSARFTADPIGTLAFPVRDHMNMATVSSLVNTDWKFLGGDGVDRVFIQGSILTLQRNEAIQKMRGGFLLFIDDDMVWRPHAIGQLVEAFYELDSLFAEPVIVGGLCFRRSPPYPPTLYMRESATAGGYRFLEKWDDGYVEVDATGCAFMLISVAALEAIAGSLQPPFEERVQSASLPAFFRWTGKAGEDITFCQDAKQAGCRIFVDTRIEIGHVSEVEIRREHFLREIAMRSEEEERQCATANTLLGLPTLSSTEAKISLGWT